jgi:anti-sigma factor RsiW
MKMPISEQDLELLEAYLDGELPMAEAELLWRRLSSDKELSAELDELRAARAIRQAVWEAMEPNVMAASAVAKRVDKAIRTRRVLETSRRWLGVAVAVAACVLVGFRIGWVEHVSPTGVQLAGSDLQRLAHVDSQQAPHQTFTVAIRDQNGNVVSMPHFETRQDAIDFTTTLNAMQQSQGPAQAILPMQRRDPSQNIVPVNDVQF